MRAVRLVIVALLIAWAGIARAEVAVPQLTGRVVDQTATLSGDSIATLNQALQNLQARKGSQIAVLIVPTTQPETIEQFSIRVAEAWKIGRKKIDDGALLVVAKNDRHLRIEVGYGLEGALTDATTKRIIDEDITPKFRSGDFAGGISAGVSRMIRIIDGEQLPAPEPEHWQAPGLLNGIDFANPFALFAVVIFGGFMRFALGRLLGSVATGGLVGVVGYVIAGSIGAALLLGGIAFIVTLFVGDFGNTPPMASGRRGRSGWSDSSGGWGGGWSGGGSSGSSSSDSGGFSGGGGSFGGGGASGSW